MVYPKKKKKKNLRLYNRLYMVEILVACLFFSFKQLIRLSLTFFLIIKMDKRKDDNKNEICLDHNVINLVMFYSISPCDL